MKAFRAQYHGRFIFEVTIVKGYNDDEKAWLLERVVKELHPDNLAVIPIDEPFQKVLGVGKTDWRQSEKDWKRRGDKTQRWLQTVPSLKGPNPFTLNHVFGSLLALQWIFSGFNSRLTQRRIDAAHRVLRQKTEHRSFQLLS